MTEMARGYWRGTRRLAINAIVVWAVLVLAVPLAAHQLEVIAVMGMPLSYYVGAQGILIGVTMLAFVFAHRQRRLDNARKDGTNPLRPERARPWARADGVPGLTGALAMAGDWLSGAMLLTLAGALYALGHDGLSWLIGLFAGVALGGMLIGPHVHRSGAASVTGFLAQRFGAVAGALAALIAALVTMLLLAANAKALVAVLAALMPDMRYGPEAGILSIAVVFIAAALRSGKPGMTTVQAVAYPLVAAVLAMLVVVTSKGIAPNIFTYGATLQAISSAELSLLQGELADPVSLKAYLRAFTTATPWDAVLLTLSLALGIAAVPHVLARPVAARSHEGARLMPAAALMMMLVAAVALAPLAAMARHGMLTLLTGQPVGSLPSVVTEMGSRGLLDVCGVRAVSQQVVTAACAALEEPPTTALRLHDMSVTSGSELLAMPWLAGLPSPAATILAVAVGIAAVLGAAWLGATLGGCIRRDGKGSAAGIRSGIAALSAVGIACGAALLVLTPIADVRTLLAWGLALSAAGLAPPLLAGTWWLRASAAGAVIGMIAGVGVTLYYIVATRFYAPSFYEMWGSLSAAGYGAIADFEAAKEALAGAAGAADRQAVQAAYIDSARAVANWFGLRDVAAGMLGAAVAGLSIGLISLVTPRPGAAAIELMARVRRPRPGI